MAGDSFGWSGTAVRLLWHSREISQLPPWNLETSVRAEDKCQTNTMDGINLVRNCHDRHKGTAAAATNLSSRARWVQVMKTESHELEGVKSLSACLVLLPQGMPIS